MQALVVEQLGVARGDRLIVRGLNFRVEPGQALHICGPNGAGKTSLLEVLTGLREAEQGRISGAPAVGQMHYLGVRNALSPVLSAQQNLEFWCGLNGIESFEVEGALKRLELSRLRHRACRTLSNGQRRRVALARLLLARRPWWLLDEPLNALDQAGAELFVQLLSGHLRAGGGAIIASHQPLPAPVDGLQRLDLP
jgi:heme exporter protein A